MTDRSDLHLFEGYGIELEYMIVRSGTLAVYPVSDAVLGEEAGSPVNEVRVGDVEWSNELVLHVIELKTAGPVRNLDELPQLFHNDVQRINALLEPMGGRLMPTAMHPWMNPRLETVFWPHRQSEIYGAYQRIFDCRSHGWANLQSIHINLPFSGDQEFARLLAAVRLTLPLLPAMACSSPVVEDRLSGFMDTRLRYYMENQSRIPSIVGELIPEPVYTIREYKEKILCPMYRDIASLDEEGILQEDWLNSRGAIANFERNTIEIRVLDVQECPEADIAIAALVIVFVKSLAEGMWADLEKLKAWDSAPLARIFRECVRFADSAVIEDSAFLALFHMDGSRHTAGQVWRKIIGRLHDAYPELDRWRKPLQIILERGPLARRIVESLGAEADRSHIHDIYEKTCECLMNGDMFLGI